MAAYSVSSIPLAPIPGVHGGTGQHQDSRWLVVPESVPGAGLLQFTGQDCTVTTMLFQLDADVVPNWFGVAVPDGISDFTEVNIFFHPIPNQAGYHDYDYKHKTGMWPQLFYYMERLGYQLDGAHRNQIIIMPFLESAALDTGVFAPNWQDIVTAIATQVRAAMGADDGTTLQISDVVISSFSVGIEYLSQFRKLAPGLSAVLAEIWDLDGRFSSESALSIALVSTWKVRAIKYDQLTTTDDLSYHVPQPRWVNYVQPPHTGMDVHGLIRDYMFRHAAAISDVGKLIGVTGTGGTSGTGSAPGAPAAGGTGEPVIGGTGISGTGTPGTGTPGTGTPGTGISGTDTPGTGTPGTGVTTSGTLAPPPFLAPLPPAQPANRPYPPPVSRYQPSQGPVPPWVSSPSGQQPQASVVSPTPLVLPAPLAAPTPCAPPFACHCGGCHGMPTVPMLSTLSTTAITAITAIAQSAGDPTGPVPMGPD